LFFASQIIKSQKLWCYKIVASRADRIPVSFPCGSLLFFFGLATNFHLFAFKTRHDQVWKTFHRFEKPFVVLWDIKI
jgi:hypothetical protein